MLRVRVPSPAPMDEYLKKVPEIWREDFVLYFNGERASKAFLHYIETDIRLYNIVQGFIDDEFIRLANEK